MAVNLKKPRDKKLPEVTPIHLIDEEETIRQMTKHSLDKTEPKKKSLRIQVSSKHRAEPQMSPSTFSSSVELVQPTIRVVAATVVLLFLFVFGDAFVRVIVDTFTVIFAGTPINDEAAYTFILRVLKVVMSVVNAALAIDLARRTIRNYKRRKHHGSES